MDVERTGRPERARAPNKRFPVEDWETDEDDGSGRNNKKGEEVENTRVEKGGVRGKRNDDHGCDTVITRQSPLTFVDATR